MVLLRELLGNHDVAFKGMAVSGHPLITVIGGYRVYRGRSVAGSPIYTISGNKLFKGMTTAGRPLAVLSGDLVFPDIQLIGSPIAKLVGNRSYKGIAKVGSPIVTVPSGDVATLFAATYHALRG
jgi:hypothetical protein